MKYTISKDRRTLTITITPKERQILAGLGESIQTNNTLCDFFEWLICNSELEWINPSQTGDLTAAPMLGIYREDGEGIEEYWGFNPYALRSPLVDLRDSGEAVFSNRWLNSYA